MHVHAVKWFLPTEYQQMDLTIVSCTLLDKFSQYSANGSPMRAFSTTEFRLHLESAVSEAMRKLVCDTQEANGPVVVGVCRITLK